jgi:hypothetical protein
MTTAFDSVAFSGFIRFMSHALANSFGNFASDLNIQEDIDWEGVPAN